MKTFYEYTKNAAKTAKYPDSEHIGGLIYTILGLSGEAGELANKVKKLQRDSKMKQYMLTTNIGEDTLEELKNELSDCLWYVDRLAYELGTDLETLAEININKLHDRLERNKIHGSGDDR